MCNKVEAISKYVNSEMLKKGMWAKVGLIKSSDGLVDISIKKN